MKNLGVSLRPFRLGPKYREEEPFWANAWYVDLTTERLKVNEMQRFFCRHQALHQPIRAPRTVVP